MRQAIAILIALSISSGSQVLIAEDASRWTWQAGLVPDIGIELDAADVIHVTSLANDGEGSLREACRKRGPRIVVFDVGGVIDLERKMIAIREGDLLIAGQTAPDPGITLVRGGLIVEADRTVVQHLRVRPGDAGQAKGSGWEPDGITTSGGPSDVWIDHCSVTWSVDENVSAATYASPTGEPARRIFIRNCLIAEGLANSTHAKGEHSKGTLVSDGTQSVAIVGNLFASNTERNPLFKLGTSGVVVNNLIANPGHRAISASDPKDEDSKLPRARLSVVGNLVQFGKQTKQSAAIFEGIANGYFADNEGRNLAGQPVAELRVEFPTQRGPVVWPTGLKPIAAVEVRERVCRLAGARPGRRDEIDQRIVTDVLSGTSRIIDSQEDVGGYPRVAPTQHQLNVPAKGRRLWLETLATSVTEVRRK